MALCSQVTEPTSVFQVVDLMIYFVWLLHVYWYHKSRNNPCTLALPLTLIALHSVFLLRHQMARCSILDAAWEHVPTDLRHATITSQADKAIIRELYWFKISCDTITIQYFRKAKFPWKVSDLYY